MLKLKTEANGFKYWAHWDETALVFEIFTDEEGVGYVGVADTLVEAEQIATEHATES